MIFYNLNEFTSIFNNGISLVILILYKQYTDIIILFVCIGSYFTRMNNYLITYRTVSTYDKWKKNLDYAKPYLFV